jgi:hypothetical protein
MVRIAGNALLGSWGIPGAGIEQMMVAAASRANSCDMCDAGGAARLTPIMAVSKRWDNGFRHITSSGKEIRTSEDLKG